MKVTPSGRRLLYITSAFLSSASAALAQTVGGGVSGPIGNMLRAVATEAQGAGRYIIAIGVILTGAYCMFGKHDTPAQIARTIFGSVMILGTTTWVGWVAGF